MFTNILPATNDNLNVPNNSNESFLVAFDKSLQDLKGVDAIINKQSADKAKFLDIVTKGLTDINAKLQILNTQIAKMKNELDKLKSQTDTNNTSITNATRQKAEMEAQLAKLTAEKDALKAQLDEQGRLSDTTIADLQKQNTAANARKTDLFNENSVLKTKIEALNKELANKGPGGQASADQIKQLTEANAKMLADQAAQNTVEIDRLTKTITDKDAQIQELTRNMNAAKEDVAHSIAESELRGNEFKEQIRGLDAEITKLKAENQKLIDKITEATKIINDSLAKLNGLTNEVANAKNLEDIDKLFNAINKTIEDITAVLATQSGNLPPTAPSSASLPSVPPPLFPVQPRESGQPNDVVELTPFPPSFDDTIVLTDVNGKTYSYGWLIKDLQKKSDEARRNGSRRNKFMSALEDAKKITTMDKVDEIPLILHRYDINLKDKSLMGGRTRRHKGGFLIQSKRHVANKSSRSLKLSNSSRLSNSARLSNSSKSKHSMRKYKSRGGRRTKKRRK